MLELDSSVMEPAILLERVRKNVLMIEGRPDLIKRQPSTLPGGIDYERMGQDLRSMLENIQMLNSTWRHQDAPITSHIKLLGPIIVFFKRAIRKSIYWFTQPYMERQSAFNGAVTRAVSDSLRAQEQLLKALKNQ